ncbi:MAG: hypothetical protein ACI39R_01645, partial [Lachnospiraceae bacterium]
YELGSGDVSATSENKALTLIYNEAMSHAYEIFNSDMTFEGVNNVYELNEHPNEVMEVDDVLYEAFELLNKSDNRTIYLAPVFEQYDDMFYCDDDVQTFEYDPYQNAAIAEEYAKLASFAADSSKVNMILLGDNKVKLFVSDDYLEYAEENGIGNFIDFIWMKNAFFVDYIADTLISKGYTNGTISSFDGFSRNLDTRGTGFKLNIYDRIDCNIYTAGVMEYSGSRSIVSLRDYKSSELDYWYYYEFSNGETRNSYLDITDGKCRNALTNLVSYSDTKSCAQIVMEISDIFISDEFNENALVSLADRDIYSVYCIDRNICYNDSTLKLVDLYDRNNVKYTLKPLL